MKPFVTCTSANTKETEVIENEMKQSEIDTG